VLGLVFGGYESAFTTTVVIASFLRFAGDELTMWRVDGIHPETVEFLCVTSPLFDELTVTRPVD